MPVPKLDLAPKLKRPLSLWNPLDYLRLLYWVFYFPQALRWYVDTFGGGDNLGKQSISKKLDFLRQHPVQLKLTVQGIILTAFTPFILSQIFQLFRVEIFGLLAFIVISSVVLGVFSGLFEGVAYGVSSGVALSMIFSLLTDMAFSVSAHALEVKDWALVIVLLMGIGWSMGLIEGIRVGIIGGVALSMPSFVATVVAFVVTFVGAYCMLGVLGVLALDSLDDVVFMSIFLIIIMALGIAVVLGRIRLDNWLISTPVNLLFVHNQSWLFPRATSLPLPKLTFYLYNWLLEDWEIGLDNINQLLRYSLQFIPVISALNKVLNQTPPEHIIYCINQLAQHPEDWKLLHFTSASLENELKFEFIKTFFDFPFFFFIPRNWKQKAKSKFTTNIRLDTPSRACAAGFWYLHEQQPEKATEAFTVVRSLLYGEELYILAKTLAMFQQAAQVNDIASLEIPIFPTENLLRPSTWQAMNSLKRVVDDIKLIQYSTSRNTKSFAYSRAIGELAGVIANIADVPEAENGLIIHIAIFWQLSLVKLGKDIGNVEITKPVKNPYVIGNPVRGSLFVGREDILRQLEELWITGNQLQSVVLYGHRRMGKTSILVNIANATGSQIKVIYVNLQRLGAVSQGVAEVLMAISDEIATAFKISPPDDDDFLKLPQRTFERYLKQVVANMPYRGLIIALDEFETIEELIEQGQIDPAFMGFLRGLVQMNPEKIAFAFAGLHTLEEMTADYFEPFFASVIPIRVSFLNPGATKTILANPVTDESSKQSNYLDQSPLNPPILGDFPSISPQTWGVGGAKTNSFPTETEANQTPENNEFLLDYTGEALDLIYSLTSGQPYLVQLIGFQLVRNYNDRVFEQGRSRDNTFTVEDIEAVINQKFFQQGRYYFEGVWGQAAQGATGQQEIIKALAPHLQGLNKENLASTTNLDTETFAAAIETLKRHDVIAEKEGNYYIIVELFRRWVLMR